MKITGISQLDWNKLLKEAAGKEGKKGPHKYIGIQDDSVNTFDSLAQMQNSGYRKMSLDEMTKLSQTVIENGNDDLKVKAKIARNVERLANAKSDKLNSCGKKVGRAFLSVVKYVSYASLIGIPLARKIGNFQKNVDSHQKQILDAKRFAKIDKSTVESAFLGKIKEIIGGDAKKHDAVVKAVEGSIASDMKSFVDGTQIVMQFHKDHTRAGTRLAVLHDETQNIWSASKGLRIGDDPIKNRDKEFRKIQQVASYKPGDEKWSKVIQAVATQSIGNAALTGIKVESMMACVDNQWYDGNTKPLYRFQERHVPVEINVIRNSKTRKIEKLVVQAVIPSNIYQVASLQNAQGKSYEKSNIFATVNTTIKFNVTLDNAGNPKVQNLVHEHLLKKK